MSSSGSIGCRLVLIACLVFLGTAARRSVVRNCFLPPTLGNFSMRDAIEKAGNAPCLREFAAALQFRSNSAVHIRAASRFLAPAHPTFPKLAAPKARTREFRQS